MEKIPRDVLKQWFHKVDKRDYPVSNRVKPIEGRRPDLIRILEERKFLREALSEPWDA